MEACRTDIEIGDTAVGRLEKKRKADFARTATKFTEEEWAEMTLARSVEMPSTSTEIQDSTDS